MNHVLIVEDDSNTLAGLQELLKQEGYVVQGVTRGHAAIEVVRREPIDMVLCDYCLPDIDGLQVCRELKRLQPHLILIMVTAYRNLELVNAAQQCGLEAIIDKPVVVETLLEALSAGSAKLKNHFRSVHLKKIPNG
jgi:CheY-like chemotaxis protein